MYWLRHRQALCPGLNSSPTSSRHTNPIHSAMLSGHAVGRKIYAPCFIFPHQSSDFNKNKLQTEKIKSGFEKIFFMRRTEDLMCLKWEKVQTHLPQLYVQLSIHTLKNVQEDNQAHTWMLLNSSTHTRPCMWCLTDRRFMDVKTVYVLTCTGKCLLLPSHIHA